MVRSGKYYPSSSWAVVRWGGAATIDRAKLETIVRMTFEPTVTTPDDIATVFFEKPEYTFRYNDAVDDVETVMGSAGPLEKLRPY